MFTILGDLLTWVLSLIFGKKAPAIQDIAASNATAQTELAAQEAANAIETKAGTARAAADAGIMRDGRGAVDTVDSSSSNPLNQNGADFRD